MTLLAPSPAGRALVGPGPGEVGGLLAWESREIAALLGADDASAGPLADRLSRFDAAIAYTRNAALLAKLGALVPRVVARDPEPDPGTHAALWLAGAVETLGCDPRPDPPVLSGTPEETAAAERVAADLPEGFLAIHPGSGSPRKNWPPDGFAALAQALSGSEPWLLVEGAADREAVAAVRARAANAIVVRELPPRSLGALLARAGLYVGNDSGVSHLAAAFGAPTLALFGPSDPAIWSPVGPRVTTLRACASLETLAVEEVLAALGR